MSADTQPGVIRKIELFPYTAPIGKKIRKIGVPSGSVTITSGKVQTTFAESDLDFINHHALIITSIDSAENSVVFVTL